MNSRHLTGHAVDLAPMVNNRIPWDDWHAFVHVAKAMKQAAKAMEQAAKAMELPLQWGGDWKNFRDGPHFELPRECYP